MRKFVCFFLIIVLLTGCSIHRVEEKSFDSIIKSVLYQDTELSNVNFDGYKFYLPRGTKIVNKNESNLTIEGANNVYYLYVDAVSYFYKTKSDHVVDNSIFYSINLNYKNSFGYIDITEVDDKYFLEVMYNYAKIESYVSKEDLYDSFGNICYILATIDYNDASINYRLSNKEFSSLGEEFDIFKSKKDNENFLQWVEQYDKYDEKKTKDQDIIETEED